MTTRTKYIAAGVLVAAIAALSNSWLLETFPPKVWITITFT